MGVECVVVYVVHGWFKEPHLADLDSGAAHRRGCTPGHALGDGATRDKPAITCHVSIYHLLWSVTPDRHSDGPVYLHLRVSRSSEEPATSISVVPVVRGGSSATTGTR